MLIIIQADEEHHDVFKAMLGVVPALNVELKRITLRMTRVYLRKHIFSLSI